MDKKKECSLEILEDGIIQLLIQTIYFKEDGSELTRDNWRTTLMPGEFNKVEELQLSSYHINIIKAAWTNEKVEMYNPKK